MSNIVVPEPEAVLDHISRLIEPLYQAAEHGTTKAQSYEWPRDERSGLRQINPHLAPAIARYEMRQYLVARGEVVSDEFELDEDIPNNGICFAVDNYLFRILKAYKNGLPSASSDARRDFYCQTSLFPLLRTQTNGTGGQTVNFAILWVVNPDYSLNRLMLACPKSANQIRENGKITAYAEAHYISDIPHPGEGAGAIAATTLDVPPLAPVDSGEAAVEESDE